MSLIDITPLPVEDEMMDPATRQYVDTSLGAAAFNAALIQNYHAVFDSARYLSAAEQDMAAQRTRTDALLTALEERLAAMPKASGEKPSHP